MTNTIACMLLPRLDWDAACSPRRLNLDTQPGTSWSSDARVSGTPFRQLHSVPETPKYTASETMLASPTIYAGYIFAASGSYCRMYKLHDDVIASGRLVDGENGIVYVDEYSESGEGIRSTPATWDGHLYFGCQNGRVYCVDASDMSLAWRTEAYGSPITSSCAFSMSSNVMFTATYDGRILALDSETGDQLWEYDLRDPQGENWPAAQILSSPAISGNCLFIVAGDSTGRKLYCFGP
jgi:outer membrane protein assembly factor BamB